MGANARRNGASDVACSTKALGIVAKSTPSISGITLAKAYCEIFDARVTGVIRGK